MMIYQFTTKEGAQFIDRSLEYERDFGRFIEQITSMGSEERYLSLLAVAIDTIRDIEDISDPDTIKYIRENIEKRANTENPLEILEKIAGGKND
jgi:hypothetical protein